MTLGKPPSGPFQFLKSYMGWQLSGFQKTNRVMDLLVNKPPYFSWLCTSFSSRYVLFTSSAFLFLDKYLTTFIFFKIALLTWTDWIFWCVCEGSTVGRATNTLHSNNSCLCIDEVDQLIDCGIYCFLLGCGSLPAKCSWQKHWTILDIWLLDNFRVVPKCSRTFVCGIWLMGASGPNHCEAYVAGLTHKVMFKMIYWGRQLMFFPGRRGPDPPQEPCH